MSDLGLTRKISSGWIAWLQRASWAWWALPLLIAALFIGVEAQRVSMQVVARYPDFFGWADRAARFAAGDVRALDWAHGLYPFGYPLLLWVGVRWLGLDALQMGFALSTLGGALGLLGTFALVWQLSGNYALATVSEFFLGCLGQYLYYGSAESTDMLAAGLLIVSLAVLAYADRRWHWALAAGLLAGTSYLIRYTALLTVLLCALYLLVLALVRRDRVWALAGGAFVLGALIGASPQLIASTIVKGNPFYSNQGHNLWFTLTGSIDYLNDWNKMPMDISIWNVFIRYPRQVVDHWWLEFRNFWITNNVNFLGKPLYALLQAGFLFTVLWRDGLKKQARFLIGLYVVGHLALLAFMRLDKRFLILVMPLFVFSAVYLLWQLLPHGVRVERWTLPVRWPVILILMAWAATYPWGFRTTNDTDDEAILVSNTLHAAGQQSYRQVFSTELYLEDVADPWKHRFAQPALAARGLASYAQLLNVLRQGGYHFFIYEPTTCKELYPQLATLEFPDSRSMGLSPVFVPESGRFVIYRVMDTADLAYHSLEVTLAEGIHLLGYETFLSQNQPRGSGRQLGIYLYWKADQPLSQRLKVFTHMISAEGKLVTQHDSEPQLGTYPTDEWKPGEVVVDFHSVPIGVNIPPGEYVLQVGLYDEASGVRVKQMDKAGNPIADAAVLSKISIGSP